MSKPGAAIQLGLSCLLCLVTFAKPALGSNNSDPMEQGLSPELRERALAALQNVLLFGPGESRPLAARYLIRLDYHEGVKNALLASLDTAAVDDQTRLGTWAALAQTQDYLIHPDPQWSERIERSLMDTQPAVQHHAIQFLSEIGYQFTYPADSTQYNETRLALEAYIAGGGDVERAAGWNLLLRAGVPNAESRLAGLLTSTDPGARRVAARSLADLDSIARSTWDKLFDTTSLQTMDSPDRVYLVAALLKHLPANRSDLRPGYKTEILEYARDGTDEQRVVACLSLAVQGNNSDLPVLKNLLDDTDVEVRISAAYALCRIDRRHIDRLGGLDWMVIGLYGFGMIAVGWFYSHRNNSAEDYLLGGRGMRPWTVGLSMFATLLSTISYLSYPGEVIRYGPMILSGIAVYPLIFFVVGYFLIPSIMKLKVTSAYEILETRLGLSTRMLGGLIFLLLRLLWMATIIYVTTSAVIIPMLNWDDSWTPLVCAVLGTITVIYTSMGGLRAVVFTDVIQTGILFGGAILTMVLITAHLGGVDAWWPDHWLAHWPEPTWTLDSGARISFVGMMIAMFTWYVCTSGSDQMAIQRYLATRDAKAARRVLLIALASDAMVAGFLVILGLALLAFYTANPHTLPDGISMLGGADRLFTRYIAGELPVGVRGLVIAGLLAAAMSSLSSGVNSSSSVIAIDFVERFQKLRLAEPKRVLLIKLISCFVGAAVVGLSLYVSLVPGNIIELAYRVVNLLVAPLFLLFFMAMFVPWATAVGAWCGATASAFIAVLIAYWPALAVFPGTARLIASLQNLLGIDSVSFLWIMPASLLMGILVGSAVSLLPLGTKRRPVTKTV